MPCTHRQPSFVSAFCRIPSFTSAALYTSSTKRSSINKSSSRSSMFVAWFTTRSTYCLRRRKELACTYRQNLANSYLQRHTKRQQVSATAMTVAAVSSSEVAKKSEKDSQVRVFSYSAREFFSPEHGDGRACVRTRVFAFPSSPLQCLDGESRRTLLVHTLHGPFFHETGTGYACVRACVLAFKLRPLKLPQERLAEHCLLTLIIGLFFMRRELDAHACMRVLFLF